MTAPTPNAMPGAAPTAPAAPAAEPPPAPAAPAARRQIWPEPESATAPAAPPPADLAQPDNRPPWEKSGEPFNPERAWNLTENLRKELAEYKAKTDPIVEEREQLRRASMEENERLTEDLAAAAAREKTWRDQAVQAEAEKLANGRFIDTDAALALVGDLSKYATDQGVDQNALAARFDQLAADKPGLVAQPASPPGFTPNRAQGQAGTGGAMPLDAQIAAAEKAGDYGTSIALKQHRHYLNQQNRS